MAENVRVLIAQDKGSDIVGLIECFSSKENVQVLPVAYDGLMATEYIKKYKPNLLVIDALLSKMDGLDVISKVKSGELGNKPAIVLCTAINCDLLIYEAIKYNIDYLIIKPALIENIVEKSIKAFEAAFECKIKIGNNYYKEKEVREQIVDLLLDIGVPVNQQGHDLVVRALKKCVPNPKYLRGVTTILYPEIAQEKGISVSSVERSIRHTIESTWNRGNIDKFNEFFGYAIAVDKGRPTNSEFLARLTDILILKLS